MSKITRHQWFELVFRSLIFLSTIAAYIVLKTTHANLYWWIMEGIILVFFSYKMISRLIPSKRESMGNQKVFLKNYINKIKDLKQITSLKNEGNRVAWIVAIVWLLGNISIFILYFCKIIDREFLMIIAMAFSVCDLVCVLAICPFQRLFMRNKCCNTCRIYNWDFAMMFTPLWVVPSIITLPLVLQSLTVLIHWEVKHNQFPERFYEETNDCLSCKNCKEFMCRNKSRKV